MDREDRMPLPLSILLLCLPPIAITVAIGGALSIVRSFRRGFGAQRLITPSAMLVTAGALALHAGFFLAPLLLYTDHVTAALWLVAPIAFAASLGLVWVLMMTAGADEKFKRTSLVIFGMLVAYLLPVVVLVMHAK
jgi:hypothetical protein